MKKSELIELLNNIEGDPQICVLDWQKQGYFADEESARDGVYFDFLVDLDKELWQDEEGKNTPILCIGFQSDDFTKEGEIEWGSSLVDAVSREFN